MDSAKSLELKSSTFSWKILLMNNYDRKYYKHMLPIPMGTI